MKSIKKGELGNLIGKSDFWKPQKITGLCEYTAGIEEIDNVLGIQNFFKVKPLVNFCKHSEGLEISIMNNFNLYHFGIKNSAIKSISFEKGEVIDIEGRSVIGRAIVGGLLLGPVGAILGGASGMKDKIIKNSDNIIIIAQFEDQEQALLFALKKGTAKEVIQFFKGNFNNFFSVNS